MKMKFLSLILGIFTVLSAFTSCSSGGKGIDDIANDGMTRETQTLVVYLMSEKEVPEATEKAIEQAINKLTKPKFKTQLDLRYHTEDDYYQALETTLKAKRTELKKKKREEMESKRKEKEYRESCKLASVPYTTKEKKKTETVITEEETLVNEEYGIIEYKYPDVRENQVDIFYLGGYERYQNYIDKEWVARLNDEIDTSCKKLKEHIPGIYMNNIQDGSIYGIPNNSVIGDYTWMLLDKKLMDDYHFTSDSITAFTDENLYNFLSAVKEFESPDKVVPIKGNIEPVNMHYWSIDPETLRITNEPGIIGTTYSQGAGIGTQLNVNNIFAASGYTNQIKAIKRFEYEGGFYYDQNTDKQFAMSIVKGGYDLYEKYSKDYYVKMLERPRADDELLYSNLFCVNQLEDNVARSMEIITFIDTVAEARNIIQYGVLGENYYIDDFDVLHRNNDSYMMDVNKTGNIFMAHPEENLPATYWENGVQQNEDADVVPSFGFRPTIDDNMDTERLAKVNSLYDKYMDEMNACTSIEELEAFFQKAKTEIGKNEDFLFVKTPSNPDEPSGPVSLTTIYGKWLKDMGYVREE